MLTIAFIDYKPTIMTFCLLGDTVMETFVVLYIHKTRYPTELDIEKYLVLRYTSIMVLLVTVCITNQKDNIDLAEAKLSCYAGFLGLFIVVKLATMYYKDRPVPEISFPYQEPLRTEEVIMCSICISPLDNNTVMLPCDHTFHNECIQPWTQRSNNCPNCRANMV